MAKGGMDSKYRTDVVNSLCREWTAIDIVPLMGYSEDRMEGRLYRKTRLTEDLERFDLNVDRFKTNVYRLLFVQDIPGHGYLHLYKDFPTEYLEHFVSEHQIRKVVRKKKYLVWELNKQHHPNHLWDCLVYNRFLAEIAGVPGLPDPDEKKPKVEIIGRPVKPRPVRTRY